MGRRFERKLRLTLASLFFRLLRVRPLETNPFEHCAPEARILVVRQQNQMGDMLLATPCLRALRENLPEGRITLIASHENEAVVRNNPHVNDVLVYDKRRFRTDPRALLRFLSDLRGRNFDVCIVLSTVSFSITSALLSVMSGAAHRVGFSGESFRMGFVDKAFHVAVPMPGQRMHQSKLGLSLLQHFGISTEDLSPIMRPSDEDEEFAEKFMARFSPRPEGGAIGIHPGAGKKKNRWPASCFARLANELRASRKCVTVMMGGPSDEEVVDSVLAKLEFTPELLSGQSIGRVAAVMKRLRLFVCNDTGVLHVAASVGCPTLALFGPTDPDQWAPLADCVKTLRAPGSDMECLSAESVLAAALERAFCDQAFPL